MRSEQLTKLNLDIYRPSHYILPSRMEKYAELYGDNKVNIGFTQASRELGIRRLMAINLMKRMESSAYSFNLTLRRIKELIDTTIKSIDDYENTVGTTVNLTDISGVDEYDLDDQNSDDFASIGKKVQIDLADMDRISWRGELAKDQEVLELLTMMVDDITPEHDSKLQELFDDLSKKVEHPINEGNKKVIVFTAFADTAMYLYDNVSEFMLRKYGLHTAVVTGSVDGRTTAKLKRADMNTILTCFSPRSKDRDISDIEPVRGTVTFTNGIVIRQGEVIGDVVEQDMRRIQIRETIQSHFEKEEKLFEMGIKTLSLFFIDEVAKYRQYGEDGEELLGEYGRIFEEEYNAILNEYLTLFDTPYQKYLRSIEVADTHKGYFSIDKKTGRSINSALKRGSEFSDDISAYDLILKNKERLLSFDEPTRFIFSHSALREGWDNPNVFQICTLKHSDSSTQKRQEVGRGLRLCVNQAGNRMDMEMLGEMIHAVNKLTVIASESYKGFVADLQSDIKNVLYDRPTAATSEYFKGKFVKVDGKPTAIDEKTANAIEFYLIANQYVDMDRKVTDKYRMDLEMGTLAPMPANLAPMAEGVHTLVQAVFDESALARMVDDGKQTKIEKNDLNENFYKKEFQELWKRINHKYAYTVSFDSAELIEKSIKHIDSELFVSELTYTVSKGEQTDEMDANALERGEAFKSAKTRTMALKRSEVSQIKYDLVGKIAEGTVLTRKTIVDIIKGISPLKFAMYKANPEEFITKVIRLINEQKATMIVEHISYDQIEGEYDSTIFTAEKTSASIDKAFKASKHIQDYVFTDGYAEKSVERRFAEDLDAADEVCVYAKLPRGFHIPTPVGNYSPDWAIAFNEGTVKHIFFIAETKGTMESLSLKPIEKAKISCARKLFNEISTENVKYHDVDSYQHLLDVMKSL